MNLLIFPHQLFADHPGLKLKPSRVVLVEDSLFFGDPNYPLKFHKQKLWLHRASMKRYQNRLQSRGIETLYLDYRLSSHSLENHLRSVRRSMPPSQRKLVVAEPTDFLLTKRLSRIADQLDLDVHLLPTPGFINEPHENEAYRADKKRWFMADFYKFQRRRLGVLMDDDRPAGGKWSFDEANRKKVPKRMLGEIPPLLSLKRDAIDAEAVNYVEETFADNPGSINQLYFPSSHADAKKWLEHFLMHRFDHFGDYEDAIVEGESWLWHSVLTPSLNAGLLTPGQIVNETLTFAQQNKVPLNSLEGFLRQVVGWREFVRATYEDLGVRMRTSNHWNHRRTMPPSFYDGTTGIPPLDDTIQRVLETGYCHHIERLMILGGFMFLCEIDPDEVYRWFMEMFVDSYDWVMVPNLYSMSQNADGGLITTKPYFSGSSYVRRMSHWKAGPWCDVWDGLYWRWIWKHIDDLSKNARWALMCRMAKKMDASKRKAHLDNAEKFLTERFQ